MSTLILFCGGPAIYPGAVPKPLQLVTEGESLLELYLDTPFAADFTNVELLCERAFVPQFREVVGRLGGASDVRVVETPDQSSTLVKLEAYLASTRTHEESVTFSYPDIFYFGHIDPLARETDWSRHVALSLRPLSSRFPRITKEPYSGSLRSISNHQASVPANPVYMFGGHVMATPTLLGRALSSGVEQHGRRFANLEFEAFAWMISQGIAQSVLLEDTWLHADGVRDLLAVRSALEAHLRG